MKKYKSRNNRIETHNKTKVRFNMIKRVTVCNLLVLSLVFLGVNVANAQSSINDWGSLNRHGWSISEVVTGGATMSGESTPEGNWATLRGSFPDTLSISTTQAVVV